MWNAKLQKAKVKLFETCYLVYEALQPPPQIIRRLRSAVGKSTQSKLSHKTAGGEQNTVWSNGVLQSSPTKSTPLRVIMCSL